jgi:type IV pilus assembly protein PilV
MTGSHLKKQRGVGLIEVLVTLLILSTSLIALTALQTRSLQFNHGSYLRSQMNIYAYDILERMRINPVNLDANYTSEPVAFDITSARVTSPQHEADIDDWRRNIATNLPNGKGGIECVDADKTCKITITWTELNTTGEARDDESSFEYNARL